MKTESGVSSAPRVFVMFVQRTYKFIQSLLTGRDRTNLEVLSPPLSECSHYESCCTKDHLCKSSESAASFGLELNF